jgi:predicted nucleic acid-binding Zn finger protein
MSGVAEWREMLADAGELTPRAVERILSLHGSRGRRAVEAVDQRRVKRYEDFTVVVGWNDEYVVEGRSCHVRFIPPVNRWAFASNICNCSDAEYNLDPDDPEQRCWHAIAMVIAEALDAVDEHDQWYGEVRDVL